MRHQKIRAIGLDLDGTIALNSDSLHHQPRWRRAINLAIRNKKASFSHLSDDEWEIIHERCFGVAESVAIHRMVDVCRELFRVHLPAQELAQHSMCYLSEAANDHCQFVPGIIDVINRAAFLNIPLGIVTSSGGDYAEWITSRLAIKRFITMSVCADDAELNGQYKPGPGPWTILWRRLGVSPTDRVLVLEDSPDAIIGALQSHPTATGLLITRSVDEAKRHQAILATARIEQLVDVVQDFSDGVHLVQ